METCVRLVLCTNPAKSSAWGWQRTHHVRGKDENTFVLSTGPLRIIQKIWIILCSFPSFTSWNEESTLGHKIQIFQFSVLFKNVFKEQTLSPLADPTVQAICSYSHVFALPPLLGCAKPQLLPYIPFKEYFLFCCVHKRWQSRQLSLPMSVPAGIVFAVTGLYLDPGRLREALARHEGTALWLSALRTTRALVGYKNFA